MDMKGVDTVSFPRQTWKVNFLEMLEPRFKVKDVKTIRQRHKQMMTKVELLVGVIDWLE